MILTKKIIFKPNETESIVLRLLSFASAKLWNIGNYEKHNYKMLGFEKHPNWYEQKKRLKSEFWYKNLPSQKAQEVLNMLEKSWKSFFKLKETGGVENPNPPKYKKFNNFKYLNNGFKIDGDSLRFSLPKGLKIHLKDKYQIEDNYLTLKIKGFSELDLTVKEIEFKPLKNGNYQINITHEVEAQTKKDDNGHYLSIDLGINNMMTCYDNLSGKSFIISGGEWLSINRYFDKKIGYYQSISDAQQSAKGIKYPKKSKQ
ncbi:MAG: transposase, partial [Bacillota bacterium]|nr:transposase [Bacillota bacterium]